MRLTTIMTFLAAAPRASSKREALPAEAFGGSMVPGMPAELPMGGSGFGGVGQRPQLGEFNSVSLDVSDNSGSLMDMMLPMNAGMALPSGSSLMPAARAHAAAANAMSALQTLMMAQDPQDLQNAIFNATMVDGVPPEALHVARKRLTLLQSVGANGEEAAASAAAYLQQQMGGMLGELQTKMNMMASLQARLEAMQMAQQQLEEENAALRAGGGGGGGGRRVKSGGVFVEEEDEEEKFDRLAREGYQAAKDVVMECLSKGKMPNADQYMERDVHLYRLADGEIAAEYQWYTSIYLAEDTAAAVRGMAEMTLIKLGEIVDQPQRKRVKMIERQAEEAKRAKEAREREEGEVGGGACGAYATE